MPYIIIAPTEKARRQRWMIASASISGAYYPIAEAFNEPAATKIRDALERVERVAQEVRAIESQAAKRARIRKAA